MRRLLLPRIFLLCLIQAVLPLVAEGQALTHGPVVGGVTESVAKVFVRTSQAAAVVLRYGTDPNLQSYAVSAPLSTSASDDFTKIIPLDGLSPETTYYLNVVVNGVPQTNAPPYPSFTSFPAPGTSKNFRFLVLADFATVQTLTHTTEAFVNAAAELPAFVFLGGDFDHRNPITLATKRKMFKELYDPATPYMSEFVPLILQRSPIIHQWDDHDAGGNNVDRTFRGWSLSQQVFQEYVPSYPLPPVTPGIWQKFSYAQADCFVLDCRSQKDPENDVDDSNKSMLDGNKLGTTGQLEWLKNGLLMSTARWKVIFTSVVTNTSTKFPDGWSGYQTEWKELEAFISSNHIAGVVFISGDLHLGAIDNGTSAGFPEMCVPAANPNKEDTHCSTSPEGIWSEGYVEDPCGGYGRVTVLTDPDRLILEAVDPSGATRVSYTVSDGTPTPSPTPTPAPPVITRQPADQTVAVGKPAKFIVIASSTFATSYRWQKNGADIAGASKNSYITPPTRTADNGALFSVIVSNIAGTATSRSAKLTVTSTLNTVAVPHAHR